MRFRGFSLLELVVSLSVFSVLVGVFAQRFLYMQEFAEKTAMELTVMNMRTGLRFKAAELMTRQRMADMPALLEENPIHWLERPPENYVGEFVNPAMHDIQPGSWYFDIGRKQLVYRLNQSRYFNKVGEVPELRFGVKGIVQKKIQNEILVSKIEGVRLEALDPIQWF